MSDTEGSHTGCGYTITYGCFEAECYIFEFVQSNSIPDLQNLHVRCECGSQMLWEFVHERTCPLPTLVAWRDPTSEDDTVYHLPISTQSGLVYWVKLHGGHGSFYLNHSSRPVHRPFVREAACRCAPSLNLQTPRLRSVHVRLHQHCRKSRCRAEFGRAKMRHRSLRVRDARRWR